MQSLRHSRLTSYSNIHTSQEVRQSEAAANVVHEADLVDFVKAAAALVSAAVHPGGGGGGGPGGIEVGGMAEMVRDALRPRKSRRQRATHATLELLAEAPLEVRRLPYVADSAAETLAQAVWLQQRKMERLLRLWGALL